MNLCVSLPEDKQTEGAVRFPLAPDSWSLMSRPDAHAFALVSDPHRVSFPSFCFVRGKPLAEQRWFSYLHVCGHLLTVCRRKYPGRPAEDKQG